MTRFAQRAVEALHAAFESGLVAQLRAVETAQGLESGELTNPRRIALAQLVNDNASPLVQIFDEGGTWVSQRQDVMAIDCTVAVSWTSGTDLEEGELFGRRYLTALVQVIEEDPSLGGEVVAALLKDYDRSIFGDQSSTRHVRALGVEVRIHTPEGT